MENSRAMEAFMKLFDVKEVEQDLYMMQQTAMSGAIRALRRYFALEDAVKTGKAGRKPMQKPEIFKRVYDDWYMGDMGNHVAASLCGVSVATWYKWVHDEEIRKQMERNKTAEDETAVESYQK